MAVLPGTLDDHAYVADGLIALYEATGEGRWLEEAHRLTRLAVELFYDARRARLLHDGASDAGLIQRPVSQYDSAVPSGMSVCLREPGAARRRVRRAAWLEIADAAVQAYFVRALENPFGFANLLNALDLFLSAPTEIVLSGEDPTRLERALASLYLPNRVIVHTRGAPALVAALVAGKPAGGRPRAWVCHAGTCQLPEEDPENLQAALEST